MANCNRCGIQVLPNEIYKREIYVGSTKRVNYGKRLSFGNSNHYRLQSVCRQCATDIDENNRKSNNTLLSILFIIGILIVVYFLNR